jgi:heptosyltransferase II
MMAAILIIKTAALGDVLRTTSILPGLKSRCPECDLVWVTSPGAVDLVRNHPLLSKVEVFPTRGTTQDAATIAARLAGVHWSRVISLDDEVALCRLASSLTCDKLSGAYLVDGERRAYTADVAPWFDMGLLSVHGKARADELKILNQRSHPQIYAEMLGIAMGKPKLVLGDAPLEASRAFAQRHALSGRGPLVGLNTGADQRWASKQLSVERTVQLARKVGAAREGKVTFVLLGGPAETERNRSIADGLKQAKLTFVDAGCSNEMLNFAALLGLCDVLITSDTLALHIAIALDVRVVAYFAPTSAAEIEFYGLGECIRSTAPDYCSYRPDADNSTLTPERLLPCVLRQIEASGQPGQCATANRT